MHLAVVRSAQDGAQLVVKHLRLGQAQADGAQTERRIGRDAFGVVDALVGAEVEGTDGDGQAVHVLHHLAIGFELFVLGRQVAAIQIQELGAEQSHAVGTVLHGAGNIVRQLDVGVQFDRRAVQRCGPGFS